MLVRDPISGCTWLSAPGRTYILVPSILLHLIRDFSSFTASVPLVSSYILISAAFLAIHIVSMCLGEFEYQSVALCSKWRNFYGGPGVNKTPWLACCVIKMTDGSCNQVVVTNPDVRGRQEILDLYLQDKPLGEDVDVTVLARGTPGFSGAGTETLGEILPLSFCS